MRKKGRYAVSFGNVGNKEATTVTDETREYLTALRHSRRWNVDLRPLLTVGPDLAGVVLHDEFSALRRARTKLENGIGGIEIYETDSSRRFKGMIVDSRSNGTWKRVLLLETGMGSMNASLTVYEVAAALFDKSPAARRLIKVGTCSGLYPDERPGTVLTPLYALADEGATKWNQIPSTTAALDNWLEDRFLEACNILRPTMAGKGLARSWSDHLENKLPGRQGGQRLPEWWSSFRSTHGYLADEEVDAAIWSIDNFHGVRSLAKRIYGSIRNWIIDHHPRYVPLGFENECSSHYSACTRTDLEIAPALVVSWGCDHVERFTSERGDTRGEGVKAYVHETEADLVFEAVQFLLA